MSIWVSWQRWRLPDPTEEESIAMERSRSAPRTWAVLTAMVVLLATACNASTSPAPSVAGPSASAGAPTALPSPSTVNITPAPIAAGPGPNGGTVVRWFIGLGGGTQPAQIGPEQAFITAYNASQ